MAMATSFEIRLPAHTPGGADLACKALDRVDEIESQLTVYRDDSEVSRVNATAHDGPVAVERGLFDLLELAKELREATGGAYDVAAGALSLAWGFTRGPKRRPTAGELAEARKRTGSHHLTLDREASTVAFDRAGIVLNFGGIGKGHALDEAAKIIRDYWWSTSALIHGGHSSVYALGSAPGTIAGAWRVGLRNPFDPSRPLGEIALRNRGLGTSGLAFQSFEVDGQVYGHILDPRTGIPPRSDCASVSVLAETAAEADALSTAFFVMDPASRDHFLSDRPDVAAIFVLHGDSRRPPRLVLRNVGPGDFSPDLSVRLTIAAH